LERIGKENTVIIEYKDWDSDVIGRRVGQIVRLDGDINFSELIPYDYVYSKIPEKHIDIARILQSIGFSFVEVDLSFKGGIDIEHTYNNEYTISQATEADLLTLYKMSDDLFVKDRYTKEFGKQVSNIVYRSWIKNCITKRYGDVCFIATKGSTPFGFITCRLVDNSGNIDLIAKYPTNDNLADMLVNKAKKFFYLNGCDIITTATQSTNPKSIRLWERNSIYISGSNLVLSIKRFQ
jgi:hypothetical protein